MKKLIKNYIYNLSYQILVMVIPLLLLPYLSRTIGVDGTGVYSYTYTVAQYFVLFGMLGIKNYGIRTIAKVQDNRAQKSRLFCSLYTMQIITSCFAIVAYLIYSLFITNENYKIYFYIQLIYVVSAILDISWYFSGIEDFKKILIRNIITKILTIILIFALVKSEKDIWIYTFIMALSYFVGNMILWINIKKQIDFNIPNKSDVISHFLPNLKLFIAVIAVSIYTMMDKIMIEALGSVTELGFYEYAQKINYVQVLIVSAFGTVMLPRMSNIAERNEHSKFIDNINKSLKFIMFLSFAFSFGIIGLSETFVPLYLGKNLLHSAVLLRILSISTLFVSWGNVIRTQYLIPKEKDNVYIISVILGALVNLIINLLLIPKFQAIGACIATVIAEATVMMYQAIKINNEINLLDNIRNVSSFLIKAIIMLVIIMPLKNLEMDKFVILFMQITIGGLVYLILNYKYIYSLIKTLRIKGNNI